VLWRRALRAGLRDQGECRRGGKARRHGALSDRRPTEGRFGVPPRSARSDVGGS
jgi:hypothetical protein